MSTIAVKKVKLGDNADTSKNFLIEVPAVADGTLTIKREDGTNVLSINAAGKAVIPGVVGTVAQVGGVPTGQVVERGSNANGEYVRFADGTQVCWANKIIATTIAGVANGVWNYPATFAGVPPTNTLSILTSNPSAYLPGVGNDTTSSVTHYIWSSNPGVSISGRAIAVGRWF